MSQVDVIVPCYNYGHFLRECLESVLIQENVQVRVLVLDDASTDQTAAVAGEMAAGDERIVFRRHAINRGHIATYNEGLDWAGGDYLMVLDPDDVLTPGALSRAATLMDAHPLVGLTYGMAINIRDSERPPQYQAPPVHQWVIVSGSEWVKATCDMGLNLVPQPTAVVRTSLQKTIGGFRQELPHAGDMEMWLRFAAHGSVGFIKSAQAYYRLHGTNMSYGYEGLRDFQQRKATFNIFFAEYGHRVADGGSLRELALCRLAEEARRKAGDAYQRGNLDLGKEFLAFALEAYPPLGLRGPSVQVHPF